jgi:outer membrane protein assembly factor BamB
LGLYFIRQSSAVEGFAPCTPFMVTLPGTNDDGYVYEVNASPKTEVARLTSITIKKVWNTDASTQAADSVTVQLLQNGNVVNTAILNEQNHWQVTYSGMSESDAYSIEEVDVPKGFTATYKQSGYVFTVTNTATLAQTGQLMWPIPVLTVSGMLLIAVGITLLKKKRKTNA